MSARTNSSHPAIEPDHGFSFDETVDPSQLLGTAEPDDAGLGDESNFGQSNFAEGEFGGDLIARKPTGESPVAPFAPVLTDVGGGRQVIDVQATANLLMEPPAAAGPLVHIDGDNLPDLLPQMNASGESWSWLQGVGTELTVSFPTWLSDLPQDMVDKYNAPEEPGFTVFEAFNDTQKANAIKAFGMWADVSGLTFDFVEPGEEADIYLFGRQFKSTSTAAATSSGVEPIDGSEIKFNTEGGSWTSMSPGTNGFRTLLHEIGHSLGLSHPGHYDAVDTDSGEPTPEYDTHAEFVEDSSMYSVMSHFDSDETGGTPGKSQIVTARSYDMWVIQHMYGANWEARDGDSTYGFLVSPDVAGTPYDMLPGEGGGSHLTIWDAGGDNDWLDMTADTYGTVLNLNPGSFSSTHNEINNISMAFVPPEDIPEGKNILIEHARGGFANDVLIGNEADNILEGRGSNDLLIGMDGDDSLYGGTGDDTLQGGFGTDYLDGGSGRDRADFTHSDADWTIDLSAFGPDSASNAYGSETLVSIEEINGSHGDDHIIGGDEDNYLFGSSGNDTLEGGFGDDSLYGGADQDRVIGGQGDANVLNGGTGFDTLDYTAASGHWDFDMLLGTASSTLGHAETFSEFERIEAGAGFDKIYGSMQADQVFAGAGSDVVHGRSGDDYLNGEAGNDILSGGIGNDIIVGGAGTDTARYADATSAVTVDLQIAGEQNTGGAGNDLLLEMENIAGSGHDDILKGNSDANYLTGNDGDDELQSRAGNDTLAGGEGDDVLEGGDGNDSLIGGNGRDAASYYYSSAGVVVYLGAAGAYNTQGAGSDTYIGIEDIVGSFFNDTLYGDAGNNRIFAGDGNDLLVGGDGSDDLYGGDGNDTLIGGKSNDYMDGGAGIDWVRYLGATGDLAVDLSDTTNQWTGAGSDRIVNVENLEGGGHDDELAGDDGANHIRGMGGDDTLYGGEGVDTLEGGTGNDVIYAGLDRPGDGPGGFVPLAPAGQGGGAPGGLVEGAFSGMVVDEGFLFSGGTGLTAGGGARGGNGRLPAGGGITTVDGSGPDILVFSGSWGDDEVFDFTPGGDKLDFRAAAGVHELADLSINNVADGVMISHGNNSVLLHDIEQMDLSNSDFWF